jgi:hypothetical protein
MPMLVLLPPLMLPPLGMGVEVEVDPVMGVDPAMLAREVMVLLPVVLILVLLAVLEMRLGTGVGL